MLPWEAAVRYGVGALPLTDRLSGRPDLRRGRVVAMQVGGVAVAPAARLGALADMTAGQAAQS